MPDRALPTDEQILARATKRAIQAAGGLEVCQRETGISDSQLSRCCSPHQRDSITIRDAAAIDAIGHGQEGAPFILHALTQIIGGHFVVRLPEIHDGDAGLIASTLELATELGDVSRSISEAMSSSSGGGSDVTAPEAQLVLSHLTDLDRASARLRHRLEAIVQGGEPKK